MNIAGKILELLGGGVLEELVSKIPKIGDKRKAKAEAKAIIERALNEEESAFRNFVLDYEGRAKDQTKFMQNLRGSVRPVLTYTLAGFFIYMVYRWMGMPTPPDKFDFVLKLVFGLNMVSLSFWYGDRALQRLGFKDWLKNGNGAK